MEQNLNYAGFWRRVAAAMIDLAIFIIPAFLLQIILFFIIFNFFDENLTFKSYFLGNTPQALFYSINAITYLIWGFVVYKFLTGKWQATPGKRIMSIYVTNKNGQKIDLKTALIRISLPILLIICLSLISESPSDKKDEAHFKFIEELETLMPQTTQSLIDSDLPAMTFIKILPEDENIRDIYLSEYASLSEENRELANAIGQNLISNTNSNKNIMWQLSLILIWYVVFAVWYLMAAFTKEKTTFHDLIADTRVLQGKAEENI